MTDIEFIFFGLCISAIAVIVYEIYIDLKDKDKY